MLNNSGKFFECKNEPFKYPGSFFYFFELSCQNENLTGVLWIHKKGGDRMEAQKHQHHGCCIAAPSSDRP